MTSKTMQWLREFSMWLGGWWVCHLCWWNLIQAHMKIKMQYEHLSAKSNLMTGSLSTLIWFDYFPPFPHNHRPCSSCPFPHPSHSNTFPCMILPYTTPILQMSLYPWFTPSPISVTHSLCLPKFCISTWDFCLSAGDYLLSRVFA